MTTVAEIVTSAFRKVGIAAEDESLSGASMEAGVDSLNRMLFAWKLSGVDTTPTALKATDTFPLSAEYEEGTIYMLAERISPDYERPRSFDADDFFRKIQAAYISITAQTLPKVLTELPSQRLPDPRGT